MVRNAICGVTGWTREDIKVCVPDVGGGFGTKANVYGEEIVLAVLARHTGDPVIWIEDRQEHLVASAQARDQLHKARLAWRRGRILAWEDDFIVDIGAGSLWVAGIVANTAIHLLGPYRVPAARISGRAALTNKTLVAQYRGAGRPKQPSLWNAALTRRPGTGTSVHEIRRRNLLTADDLPYPRPIPYRDGVPIAYDGKDYRFLPRFGHPRLPRSEVTDWPLSFPDTGSVTGCRATWRPPDAARTRPPGCGCCRTVISK